MLASNSKLASDKHKKCLENNLCLYCDAGDYKLDSCSKDHGASATTNSLAAASEKFLESLMVYQTVLSPKLLTCL